MNVLNQRQKIMAMAVISVVIIVIGYYYINSTKEVYSYTETNSRIEEDMQESENDNKQEKIIIHITGGVKNQGIVEVKEDARINDAIKAAGGTTENADLSNVNLAYKIQDGQKIYIPTKEDKRKGENTEELVSENSGDNVLEEVGPGYNRMSLININTASAELLEQIPGIGNSTALKIIEYRKSNGKFKTKEDIKNVSGIGDAKYESIKQYIFV